MAKPRGNGWRLLGVVGVDSGQLVVCDPCYIGSEWIPGQDPAGHPMEVLTEKGKKRFPDNKDWSWRFNYAGITYESPQEGLGGLSVNEAREQGLVKVVPNPVKEEFSYRGCCDASQAGGKALPYKHGHEGVAVCFSSGYGDGSYEVWGRENHEGRIIEVRILMNNEDIFNKITGRG
jgi:hypothetical protein